jgi:hypothetical protein
LCQDVNGAGPLLHKLLQKLIGLHILLLRRGILDAIGERREKLAFFRSHIYSPRDLSGSEMDMRGKLHNRAGRVSAEAAASADGPIDLQAI